VVSATVDSETGLVVEEGCEAAYAYRELFLTRHVPATACPGETPMMAGEDDGPWERGDVESAARRARDAYVDALREEIERRLREHQRRMEDWEGDQRKAEKRRRKEERKMERERRSRDDTGP
jgi:hypothetical protein